MSADEASDRGRSEVSADERTWGMVAHLAALVGIVLPFGNILGPLVVWLARRGESSFVDDHAKEALNFNITVAFGALVCFVLVWLLVGILLFAALVLYWLAMTIVAAIKASEGARYHYPFVLRLVT
ncbi:MAG TPA: DUF4870 domain-containing protein [Steroidobacteraceae bacterium]|nr:DUF4870 domain-containing protein [Steroidobacteraceae bacterium]